MFALKSSVAASVLAKALDAEFFGKDIFIDNVSSFSTSSHHSLCFSKTETKPSGTRVIIANYTLRDSFGTEDIVGIHGEDPRLLFMKALEYLAEQIGFVTSTEAPIIEKSCNIGKGVYLGSNVTVGANTTIEPNAVIMDNTHIGERCLIRANTTIGSDGFGYERLDDSRPLKFIHLGGVIIGNDVEIGANTCIAKGTLGNTVIEDNVKIDNLVHVAHNCVIRDGAFVIACAEISGGVEIGKNAWVAPNVCVRQQLKIGENAIVGLGAVVTKDVANGDVVAGNPAKSFQKK